MHQLGKTQQKILLLLGSGIALGMTRSSKQYFKVIRDTRKEWLKINQFNFNRSIHSLAKEKLVEEKTLADGSFKLVLTPDGRKRAATLNILGNTISFKKPRRWDGQWRIVMFDIPEKDRLFRDILRAHLYNLEFYKLQQSVFVSPYPFEKAILSLVAVYAAEPHVRVITATKIDNEAKLKKHFFKSQMYHISTAVFK
jgi:DNA-binding transcriptional regulator PaaX